MKVTEVEHTGSTPRQVQARAVRTDGKSLVEIGFQHNPSLKVEAITVDQAEMLVSYLNGAIQAIRRDPMTGQ